MSKVVGKFEKVGTYPEPEVGESILKDKHETYYLIFHLLSREFVYGGPGSWHLREYSYEIRENDLDSALEWCKERGHSQSTDDEGYRVLAFKGVRSTKVVESIQRAPELL